MELQEHHHQIESSVLQYHISQLRELPTSQITTTKTGNNISTMFEDIANSTFFSSHPLLQLLNVIQFINLPMMYLTEIKAAMPYSKFAASFQVEKKQAMIHSRAGMLIIYAPALVAAAIYMLLARSGISSQYRMNLAAWMVLVHFLKRTLEVLFLHKYSGSTILATARMIGFAYAFQATMICATSNPNPNDISIAVGNATFVIGIVGNFYHHYLLASLRASSDRVDQGKKYTAPTGGMFEYVAAPHYLFELIGWLGIAVASEQITAYLTFGGMVAYLAARSVNQNSWNKEKFSDKDWPASRRNLIPFIF